VTGNARDNCYPHIHLLPTHPHLASTDFIRLLPVAVRIYISSATPDCFRNDWNG